MMRLIVVALALTACGTLKIDLQTSPASIASMTHTPSAATTLAPDDAASFAPTESELSDWVTYIATGLYEIKYPQEYTASVCENILEALYPGIVCLTPTDAFNQAIPISVTYQIKIAAREKPAVVSENDPANLFLNAPLGQSLYEADYFSENEPEETDLNGEKAFVLHDVNKGQVGIKSHLVSIHADKLYDIVVVPYQVGGEDTTNLELVGKILGTFKFLGEPSPTEQSSLSLDCSPAPNLKEVGRYRQINNPHDLEISDHYAYIASDGGLIVIDISNPEAPSHTASLDLEGDDQLIAVYSDYAFVGDRSRLHLVDMTNPASPVYLRYFDFAGIEELEIRDQRLFIRNEEGIFYHYGILDPVDLTEVFNYDPPGEILGGEIAGNLISATRQNARENSIPSFSIEGTSVYLADLDGGFHIFDITQTSLPISVSTVQLPYQISDVIVIENTAYVVSMDARMYQGEWELWALDTSSIIPGTEGTLLGSIELPHEITPESVCTFFGDFYTYAGSAQPSAELSPSKVASFINGVSVSGDYLYLVQEDKGLIVFELE